MLVLMRVKGFTPATTLVEIVGDPMVQPVAVPEAVLAKVSVVPFTVRTGTEAPGLFRAVFEQLLTWMFCPTVGSSVREE
jgi:hypothetical protein